jgi:hypothetical protein
MLTMDVIRGSWEGRLMLYGVWYSYNLKESKFAVLSSYKNSPGYSQIAVIRHTYETYLVGDAASLERHQSECKDRIVSLTPKAKHCT